MRRRGAQALCWALASALAATPPAMGQAPAATDTIERIERIEVRADALRVSPAEVTALLAFAPGEELTAAAAERSLRNLRAAGLAARAAIYRRPAPPSPDGAPRVVAVVVLWADVLVDEVRVEGDLGTFHRAELEEALPQRPGQPLVESRALRGVFLLQDLFERRGFYERKVRLAPEVDETGRRAVVVYRVEAGPRATVGQVEVAGELGPYSAADLAAQLRLAPGAAFGRSAGTEAAERLAAWLIGQGRRTARVEGPEVVYRGETHTVDLAFRVAVGPRVELELTGADRKKLEKRDLLPFLGPQGYDEALLLLAVERIRAEYQRQGHYDVAVASRQERADDLLKISLAVEPGPTYTLADVAFTGNEEVPARRLAERMATAPRSLLTFGRSRLVDETLAADLANLRSYYALQGFREARVGPAAIERREGSIAVTVPIVEGPRQRVATVALAGVAALPAEELRARLPLAEGGPFHPRHLEDSLDLIRAEYERLGHAAAQVSAEVAWNPDRTVATVAIEVLEGPKTVIDRVLVRGHVRTEEAVVRRVAALEAGEPASVPNLLEAERQLYRLGIFSGVEVATVPAPPGADSRDVLIRVEEGRTRRVTYGAGYDTEDGLGGLLGYRQANLFGRAFTLTLDARVRSRRQEFRAMLDQPVSPLLGLPLTYSVSRLVEDRESFEVTRTGARVDVVRDLGRSRLALGWDYRIVENEVKVATAPLAREDQTLRISSVIPNFQVDRRDDPLNPRRGWNSVAQIQYAFPLLAAEADFVKAFGQQTLYVDLGRAGVLAASLRAGAIEPFGMLAEADPLIPPDLDLPSAEVFAAERFFAGGASSHRAFDRDRLGIPGRTLFPDASGDLVPAGGNGLVVANLDLRFPLAGPVGGTLFFDSGNVWADWRDFDASDLRSGYGVGVRYESPIGPIRVEAGWPLDRLPGDDSPVVFLSLGNPF